MAGRILWLWSCSVDLVDAEVVILLQFTPSLTPPNVIRSQPLISDFSNLLRFAVVLCWGQRFTGVGWVRGHQRLRSQLGRVTIFRLYSQKWREEISVSLIINRSGGDES